MSDRLLTHDQVHHLADMLIGTTNNEQTVLEKDFGFTWDQMTTADCAELDDRVFCCEVCGWWCGIDEMSEDSWTCRDCKDDV